MPFILRHDVTTSLNLIITINKCSLMEFKEQTKCIYIYIYVDIYIYIYIYIYGVSIPEPLLFLFFSHHVTI
jgi:hypothetical protein